MASLCGLRDRLQDWLILPDPRVASRFPREPSVAIRPHQLQAGKRPRRPSIEPDRCTQIFAVELEGHLEKADIQTDENVGGNIAVDIFLSRGRIVADAVDDVRS